MSPLPRQRRQQRGRAPTPRQQLVLRRFLTQVLGNDLFIKALKAFRKTWGMRRKDLHGQRLWVLPNPRRTQRFKDQRALEEFARFWFHALGGTWLASRLIFGADWEDRPLAEIVRELAAAIENTAADETEWRQTYKARGMSVSTAYYAGHAPFYPTATWTEEKLKTDLRTGEDWHVRPSAERDPALTKSRTFIEVFPWTDEEDLKRAFRQVRQFQRDTLPRSPRSVQALLDNLQAYTRYTSNQRLDADERVSLYRQAERVASLLGLPPPRRRQSPKEDPQV